LPQGLHTIDHLLLQLVPSLLIAVRAETSVSGKSIEIVVSSDFESKEIDRKVSVAPMMDWTDFELIPHKISTFRAPRGFDPSRDTSQKWSLYWTD
jgi:hypothetical protein